ncbi:MAG: polysaccharide biosynthesis C-terminal domain-containing protein [Bacteroidia bacterium]|nr:polysaccharide biosynthesis C-terminal domain-containing protein [Bacteroidia bacterium]
MQQEIKDQINKHLSRLYLVSAHTLSLIIPGVTNLLLSAWTIKTSSPAIWSQIVVLQLWYYPLGYILSWGNKDLLVKESSNLSRFHHQLWREGLWTRILLLFIPLVMISTVVIPGFTTWHLMWWLACRLITQSYETYAVWQQRYFPLWFSELVVIICIGVLYFTSSYQPSFEGVLWLMSISHSVRLIIHVVGYNGLSMMPFKVNPRFLLLGLPFLLLSLLALFQLKIDLYIAGVYLTADELAWYQIITALLVMVQSAASYFLTPFAKILLRMQQQQFLTLLKKTWLPGIGLNIAGTVAILVILKLFYSLTLSTITMGLMFMSTIPVYASTLLNIQLISTNSEKRLSIAQVLALVINAIGCVLLIPVFKINGALLAMNIGAWLYFIVVYFMVSQKNKHQ